MKNTNFELKNFASKIFSFVLLFLISFSLTVNPIAATRTDKAFRVSDAAKLPQPPNAKAAPSLDSTSILAPAVAYSNTNSITVPDHIAANTEPSAQSSITVGPGVSGTISSVTVTLNNINSPSFRDLDFLLVAPNGDKFVFLSDVGNFTATSGITLTLSDAGAAQAVQSATISSGTYQPTNFDTTTDVFNSPAPAGPYNFAGSGGTIASTFTSVFVGDNPNGTWNLYVSDDSSNAGTNAVISGGWTLNIVTNAAVATTTTVTSSLNPSNTNQAVTFTATVTSSTTVNSGTVNFVDSTTGATLCSNVAVNASGAAQCTVPAGTLTERIHTITANYTGNASFAASSGSIQQTVNTPTQQSGNTFTNPGGITIGDNVAGSSTVPYPSNITVSGLSGTISKVTLSLNVNFTSTNEVDLLLVGPGGQTFVFLSDAGGATASSGVVTLDDAAANPLPTSGSIVGTFRPADYTTSGNDVFPAPAPAAPYNMASPGGVGTFASIFGGAAPNGTWSLYATDDTGSGGVTQRINSWSLTFTTSGDAATSTTLTSSLNPSFTNQAVLFTATVTSGGNPVTTGNVTFRNGAAILCANVAVNASGVATCNTPAGTFAQGDFTITADYNGVAGQFNISSGSVVQSVSSPTVVSCLTFANNGAITIPNASVANPYPSRITVSGLNGAVAKVTLTLNGINAPQPDDVDFLLVGPSGQKFLFMGDAGGNIAINNANITFDDAAATQLPDAGAITTGTYRPASYTGSDIFPAPAPTAPYNPATPDGTGTFATVFNGTNPNGQWSLYAVEDSGDGQSTTLTGGWSLTITLAANVTTTTITSSANPSVFGQSVTFTATVTTTGVGTPSGSVEFFNGGTSLGTFALDGSGAAAVTTSGLAVGTRTITANYLGATTACNGSFNTSSGTLTGGQVVNKANTSVVVVSSRNPVNGNTNVMFTATVSPVAPGAGTRTGTISFTQNGTAIAGCTNVTINASAQATCTTSFPQGTYSIVAQYSGDTNFNSGNNSAAPLSQQVLAPTAAPVTISGRISSPNGRGIARALVKIIDAAGQTRFTMTNAFGYYRFNDVAVGATYVLSVDAKGYQSVNIVREVAEDLTDFNITLQR